MAGSSREFFDNTILEFMDKTSEASEDDIDALFEALPLDWETTYVEWEKKEAHSAF